MQQSYLGDVLIRRGVVTPERLEPLFETMKERGQTLTELMVQANICDETKIAQALADEAGLAFMSKIDLDAVPLAIASRVPIMYAKQHKILALNEDDGRRVSRRGLAPGATCRRRSAIETAPSTRFRDGPARGCSSGCSMLSDDPDMEYAMVDATIVKVHHHRQGAKGGLLARRSVVPKAVSLLSG